MPRVTVQNGPRSRLLCADVLLSQGVYENDIILSSDVEKVSITHTCVPDDIGPENALPHEQENELSQHEENTVASVEAISAVRDSPTVQHKSEHRCVTQPLPVPNMEVEVAHLFAQSRVMPPCPPVSTTSVESLRFWYNRVIADASVLEACNMVACCVLPKFPSPASGCDGELDMGELAGWTIAALRWWTQLSSNMATNGLGYEVPTQWRWNPYAENLVHRFSSTTATPTLQVGPKAQGRQVAMIPPPAPPVYAAMFANRRTSMDEAMAEKQCQEYLQSWWRAATRWAAAAVTDKSFQWICPPPTTASTTEAWFNACITWSMWVSTNMRAKRVNRYK